MRNNSKRTDILLPQGVSIPRWLEERGGTQIFLIQFGENGRRACCIRVRNAQVAFGPCGSVYFRDSGGRYSFQVFEPGRVLAICHPAEGQIAENKHLCWNCLRNTGRKKCFSHLTAGGSVFIFQCSHCGSEWEVTFEHSPNGNGNGGHRDHHHNGYSKNPERSRRSSSPAPARTSAKRHTHF